MSRSWSMVPDDYIEELEEDRRILEALYAAGVENWEGYEYAQTLAEESEE